jgi:hypothetical protein
VVVFLEPTHVVCHDYGASYYACKREPTGPDRYRRIAFASTPAENDRSRRNPPGPTAPPPHQRAARIHARHGRAAVGPTRSRHRGRPHRCCGNRISPLHLSPVRPVSDASPRSLSSPPSPPLRVPASPPLRLSPGSLAGGQVGDPRLAASPFPRLLPCPRIRRAAWLLGWGKRQCFVLLFRGE